MQKPTDLLLNIIDFLGILVPGAVVTALYGDSLAALVGVPKLSSLPEWIPGFLFAYVAGQALMGFSVPLNRLAHLGCSRETAAYLSAVRNLVVVPDKLERTRENVYYAAFSYLRLNATEALAEVERQAAEYKLFRSLILVAVADLVISSAMGGFHIPRIAADVALFALAAYRFHFLYDWTHRLTFDFFLQAQHAKQTGHATDA